MGLPGTLEPIHPQIAKDLKEIRKAIKASSEPAIFIWAAMLEI